jgi:hypothetical protein
MKIHFALILPLIYLPLQACCQTVQDDWTAPAAPDGSTPLQSGSKFTLIWKIGLQDNFATYCPLCDTKKLDLWITNFNGTKYTSKIGRKHQSPSSFFCGMKADIALRRYRYHYNRILRLERKYRLRCVFVKRLLGVPLYLLRLRRFIRTADILSGLQDKWAYQSL